MKTKKNLIAISLILILAVLSSCGGKSSSDKKEDSDANNNGDNTKLQTLTEKDLPKDAQLQNSQDKDIVDLTELSSTMVFSEVYAMVSEPEKYKGKKIIMKGKFSIYYGTDKNNNTDESKKYFACVVTDAQACCAQGLQFRLKGNKQYPQDYPKLGEEFVVSGKFTVFNIDGFEFIGVEDAEILGRQ